MFSSLQEREPYFLKGPDVDVGPGAYEANSDRKSPEVDPNMIYNTIEKKKSS